ncbi:MAG: aldehyde dehydrogenase family protein, partial [Verrucomicrobia bacterium]|nr:aldehyde dehydrogenase family protein [Verrucomicrobiota bacterium]
MVVRCFPGPVPPVKVTRSTRGSRTSASVIVLRSPTNVLSIAGGRQASYSSSVRRIATSGVLLDGLSSTGTPAAIAGASLCATWLRGWLNGVIAATLATEGSFRNSGQRCTAVKRILVEESVLAEFTDRFVARAGEFTVGDPADEATCIGTVIDEQAAIVLEERVTKAVA